MTTESKRRIKTYFETGDKPTQAQFINFIDSTYQQNTGDYQIATVSGSSAFLVSAQSITSASETGASAGLLAGRKLSFIVPTSISGATTLRVSGMTSAISVEKFGQALVAGDYNKGQLVQVQYNTSAGTWQTTTPTRFPVLASGAISASAISAITTAAIPDSAITSAKIADDAVTIAKLADGNDGELISWNSAGEAVTTSAGTSGQFLKSQGGTQEPVWVSSATDVSAGLGASLTLVSSVTVTASTSTVTFTGITSAYDVYQWEFEGVVMETDSTQIRGRISTPSTAAFVSAAGTYGYVGVVNPFSGVPSVFADNSATFLRFTGNIGNNTANGETGSGRIVLYGPKNTSVARIFKSDNGYLSGANIGVNVTMSGTYKSVVSAVNGVQFYPDSDTFTGGTWRMYGINK